MIDLESLTITVCDKAGFTATHPSRVLLLLCSARRQPAQRALVRRALTTCLGVPNSELRQAPNRLFQSRLEEVMGQSHFKKPVFLRLNNAGNYQAGSPWEALQYLDIHWPAARTADYRRAKAMCRSAIDGLVSPESARAYLINAAERAGVLEQGWRFSAEDFTGPTVISTTTRPHIGRPRTIGGDGAQRCSRA